MKCNEILNKIANEYQMILGNNLVGIYVHGSLAFGCFNPKKSDIDFIVVVSNAPTIEEKEALLKTLLYLSAEAPTKGYEMSVVLSSFCKNFVYPTPFELHYSIAHLQRCKDSLRDYCTSMNGTDKNDYFDSIKVDVENAKEDVNENPVYIILNLCRVFAYKKDDLILSK